MKPLGHAAITLTVGGILYGYTRSFPAFLWLLIAGVFVDADHYIDYVREHGISLNAKKVYHTCASPARFKKLVLILHSYEVLFVLWLMTILLGFDTMWKYAAIGLTLHLLIDQITNPVSPATYFLWFRATKHFKRDKLFIYRIRGR